MFSKSRILTFQEAFKGKKVYLRDKLEVNNRLLRSLVDKCVLQDNHERKIKHIIDFPDRADELLDILERRDDKMFDCFCDELQADGQGHVAEIIRPTSGETTVAVPVKAPPNDSKSPTLKHVIPSDGRRKVAGLTFINDELFVLRHPSKEKIQVYETATFTQKRKVRVAGLTDEDWSWSYKALISCDVNKCLFVCDGYGIFNIDLSTDNVKNWEVDGWPCGLSVNDARHVIVTCYRSNEVREYKPNSQLIDTIKLQELHVARPCNAVQLKNSYFVVSHLKPVNGVSLVNTQGKVIETYRNSESIQRLDWPLQLSPIGKNGSVLVVDCNNNRLVVLDASLTREHDITLPIDGRLSHPWCFYFNESFSHLIVGEERGQRVIIFDNISF